MPIARFISFAVSWKATMAFRAWLPGVSSGSLEGTITKRIALLYLASCCAVPVLAIEQAQPLELQITQFYQDLNSVATQLKPIELLRIVTYLDGINSDNSFLSDSRLKMMYDKILAIKSATVSIDPEMVKFGRTSSIEYSYTAELVQVVSRTSNNIVLEVRRASVRHSEQDIQALDGFTVYGDRGGFTIRLPQDGSGQKDYSFLEFDNWLLIDGRWRISDVHVYPVPG